MEYMESVKKLEEKMLLNQKQESNGFIHDKYTVEVCFMENIFLWFLKNLCQYYEARELI